MGVAAKTAMEIQIGHTYWVLVDGNRMHVKVTGEGKRPGKWACINVHTGEQLELRQDSSWLPGRAPDQPEH